MNHRVVLVPGDGIGPEITTATRRVVDALGVSVAWETHLAGEAAVAAGLAPLPDETVGAIREGGVALKGPLATPIGEGHRSLNVELRLALGLYANVRPAKTIPGVPGRLAGDPAIDLVVVRENTEDLYGGEEYGTVGGAVAEKSITREASRRIAVFAFTLARREGRKRVTTVHKANILKQTDGLFLREARKVAQRFPEIAHEDIIVDNATQQLLRRPETFDVLLCPNLYGDILSDMTGTMAWGSIGLGASGQYGNTAAVFEAVHGTAPDIAGQNKANPTSLLFCAVMLLEHLGEMDAAEHLHAAIARVYAETGIRTAELGGSAGTREFADAVLGKVAS